MPTNLLKRYNDFLELSHLSENQRTISLRAVFNRDIANNDNFLFREKIIRPLKKEGEIDMETLFDHLTKKSEDIIDEEGKTRKSRSIFDFQRAKRLHWIWHHIQEIKMDLKIFSVEDRKDGRNVLRTYIFDELEKYVIVLEPQRSLMDYYILSAHYLDEKNGSEKIKKKWKRRLPLVY